MSKRSGKSSIGSISRTNRTKRPGNFLARRLGFEGLEVRRLLSAVPAPGGVQFELSGQVTTQTVTSENNSSAPQALQFLVSGTVAGDQVNVYADGNAIGQPVVAGGATTMITTNGSSPLSDGAHTFTATQTLASVQSSQSQGITLTVFTGLAVTSNPAPTSVAASQPYSYTITTNAPGGDTVTVAAATGTLPSWMTVTGQTFSGTPPAGTASFSFTPKVSDLAGNSVTLSPVSVTVTGVNAPLAPSMVQFEQSGVVSTATYTSENNSSTTNELEFLVSGVTSGATVNLYDNGGTTAIATGTAPGTTITLTTDGNPSGTSSLADGQYTFTATQTVNSVASPSSPALSLQVFTSLTVTVTSAQAATATVGQSFSYTYTLTTNAPSSDAVTYTLPTSTDSNMTLTGQTVTWTPTAAEEGTTQSFTLAAKDSLGNTATALPVYVAVSAASGITVLVPPADVAVGSPVLVGFNDAAAGANTTYTVTASSASDPNGTLLTGLVMPQDNPVLQIDTSLGEMDFQLLNNYTHSTVTQFESVINSPNYTNLTFYRVIQSFMDQGGVGNSYTGPAFSTFPDELNSLLRFTSSGLLAMANNGADGNSSEFFITNPDDMSNGFLDFRYTIFGKLVAGDNVRQAIASTPVTTNSSGEDSQPLTAPTILSMKIINEPDAGVFMLQAASGATAASGPYTVTVKDSSGNTQTFTIHIGTTGGFSLSVGTTGTGQINFDSSNPTSTAASMQSALVAAGFSGTTVAVDPASTAASISFDVTFAASQSAITATAAALPVTFSNSVSAANASQVLTFVVTGTGAYDPPNPWVEPINGTDTIQTAANTKATFTPVGQSADGTALPQVSSQLFIPLDGYPGAYVDSSYYTASGGTEPANADMTLTQSGSTYTVTPTNGFYGAAYLEVTGQAATAAAWDTAQNLDPVYRAYVPVYVDPPAPQITAIEADGQAVTGSTFANNSTTATELSFNISGAVGGATVSVFVDGTPIATGTAVISGTFKLEVGSVTTGAISFDNTDPTTTATNMQDALVSAGFTGATVSAASTEVTRDSIFQVTFTSSEPAIQYVAATTALPLTFANSAAAATTDQDLTFEAGIISVTLTTVGGSSTKIAGGNHEFTVQQTLATAGATLNADITSNGSSLSPGAQFPIAASSVQSPVSAGTELTIGLAVLAPPSSYAQVGVPFTYTIQTNAPSGDTVTVNQATLIMPPGMTFNGVNTFTWTPASSQANNPSLEFYAAVSDSQGITGSVGPLDISVILGLAPTEIPVNTSLGGNVTVLFSGSQVIVYDNVAHAVLSNATFTPSDAIEIDAPAGQANSVWVLVPNSASAAIPKEILVQGTAGATKNYVTLWGSNGANTFTLAGNTVTDNGLATQMVDVQALSIAGRGSSDTYNLNSSSIASNWVVDLGGYNTMSFSQDTAGVAVNLGLDMGQAQLIAPWNTTLSIDGAINELIGSAYADLLTGGSGNDVLLGGGGNDWIVGGTAKNLIITGDGSCNVYTNGTQNMVFRGTTNYDSNDQALLNLLNQGPLFMFSYSFRRALASAAKNPTLESSLFKLTDSGVHDAIFGSLKNSFVF